MIKKYLFFISLSLFFSITFSPLVPKLQLGNAYGNAYKTYTLRKFKYVESFYKETISSAIQIGVQYNIPPAAMLAIAGLESGYGTGYISRITGNILSLHAMKSRKKLPPLYLPQCGKKGKVIIYDIKRREKCKEDLIWKKRPPSFATDYRPLLLAGKPKHLTYFESNYQERIKAQKECFKDFASKLISEKQKNRLYQDIKIWLNKTVKKEGKSSLFSKKINMEFISRVGGHNNSFNYRKSWPLLVKKIIQKAGLIELCHDIHIKKMKFKKAWHN